MYHALGATYAKSVSPLHDRLKGLFRKISALNPHYYLNHLYLNYCSKDSKKGTHFMYSL